ncbi:MAG: 30S ribosomal protein S1 [Deltaproteobacteria bacterium]|nr:30S ribosomal protein S1 [Deltaproteobacteria bacterium]
MDRENEIITEDDEAEESFEELLKQSEIKAVFYQPGQPVEVDVIQVTDEWVFIDTGSKSEGIIALSEFIDEEGNINIKEGDSIKAYFLSSRNSEKLFTTRLTMESTGKEFLEDAFHNGIPVQGVVEKEIKGGFEIRIAGKTRAFCPFSQMGLMRIEDNSSIIGAELTFKVTEYGEKGRNIILSNRAILEQEREEKKLELKESLKVGMIVNGTVTSIKKFGAFVDVNGIEGLIPISEIAWGRVENIEEILSVGQQVDVAITTLDWANNKFSFSLKEILPDPWDSISKKFPEGSLHKGKVVRTEKFGAFVNIAPGIDGLLHISELGREKRINHAREALEVGQEIEVKINGVDEAKRRVSLGRVDNTKDEEQEAYKSYGQTGASPSGSFGTLGDLLKSRLGKK